MILTAGSVIFLFCALLWVCIIYLMKPQIKMKLQAGAALVGVTIGSIILLPFATLRPGSVENMRVLMKFVRGVSVLTGISFHIINGEYLSEDQGCIVLLNHQSLLDATALGALWPFIKRGTFVAKRSMLLHPGLGLYILLAGATLIDRTKGAEAKRMLCEAAMLAKKNRVKMFLFPEGTRNKGSGMLLFKKGAFHLGVQFALPIIPVVISPYGLTDTMTIKVLPPIPPEEFPVEVDELAGRVATTMKDEYERLYKASRERQSFSGYE